MIAEVLEQLPRLGEIDDRPAQALAQLEHGLADERDPFDRPVIGALAVLPCARQLDLREVLGERPDGRADRHLVVVEHDQHLGLALADVVERLERQAAHQRGIADDDRDPLEPVAQVARLGQPLRDGQTCPGMAAIEHVVRRLGPPREAADAVELAESPEPLETPGQELVRIGLVAGIPDDAIAGRLEQAVEGDRELNDAERRAEVTARLRDGLDDGVADLDRQLGELCLIEAAKIGRVLDRRQDAHGMEAPDGGRLGLPASSR